MNIQPIIMEGQATRLEPLAVHHAAGLAKYGSRDLLKYHFPPSTMDESGFRVQIADLTARPNWVAFAIVYRDSGETIGTTSYLDIRTAHRSLEIGFTWFGAPFHGTQVNPEIKYLMLRYAFEDQGALRVQIKTDKRNSHSQRAIEKLGGVKEGILRQHVIMPDGYVRDTVMYSIIHTEWDVVKANLENRLGYTP